VVVTILIFIRISITNELGIAPLHEERGHMAVHQIGLANFKEAQREELQITCRRLLREADTNSRSHYGFSITSPKRCSARFHTECIAWSPKTSCMPPTANPGAAETPCAMIAAYEQQTRSARCARHDGSTGAARAAWRTRSNGRTGRAWAARPRRPPWSQDEACRSVGARRGSVL
jgi:hypothetical protein